MKHPLKRLQPISLTPSEKTPAEMTWEEATRQYEEIIGQRDDLVESLLRAVNEDDVPLTGDFFSDVEAIGQWLLANARTKRVKNTLPKMWWTDDTPKFVDELDGPTLNACFAVAMYISKEFERISNGKYALKLNKTYKTNIYLHMPTIVFVKGKVVLEPFSVVKNCTSQALEDGTPSPLGEVMRNKVEYMEMGETSPNNC